MHREGYGLVSFAASSALVVVGLLFWLEAETWLVQLVGARFVGRGGDRPIFPYSQAGACRRRRPTVSLDGKVVVIEEGGA